MPSPAHFNEKRPLKCCFVMGVGQRYKLMFLVAQEMIRRFDIDPDYLVMNEGMIDFLLTKKVPSERITILNDKMSFGSWGNEPIDFDFLNKMEREYGNPNLYLFWESVRNYDGYVHYSSMKMLEAVFRVYYSFIEEKKFDFAIMDAFPASLPMLVMSAIMEKKGSPFFFLIPSRIEKKFLIVRGIDDKYHRIDSIYDELKNRSLTQEERENAENFISKYDPKKRYFSTSEKAVYFKKDMSLARLKRGVGAIIDGYKYGISKKSIRRHSFWAPFTYATTRIKTVVRKQFLNKNSLFKRPVEKDRYVLFLLSKQPEASTYVKSPLFMDQRYLLECIAKSLPVGYSVYIKPHHNDFGNLPVRYYKSLISRPNMRMLDPYQNSQNLIRNSSAVITITGTVGWEGIILGKPVITFGRVFYNYFDQVIHVDDITKLPFILRDAINDYHPDRELMLKYVSAHIQGSYDGVPLSPVYTNDRSLSPENINRIVDGIGAELKLERLC